MSKQNGGAIAPPFCALFRINANDSLRDFSRRQTR
jgi:hypothetical protein